MPSLSSKNLCRSFGVLVCALAFLTTGCHRKQLNSGYGQTWVTLTSEPSDFSSYNVHIDGIYLTRSDGAIVSPYSPSYYEKVDMTKLQDVAEMLGSTSIATGVYTSATFTIDYTSVNTDTTSTNGAQVTTLVNGVPTPAQVVDTTGAAITTQLMTINFDPANPLVLNPTYATTAASRLMVDFNLAASTKSIDTTTTPVTVVVKPFATMSVSAADQRLIRVRGPLINSSVGEQTFTLYVRPFYDQADAIGLLTVFNSANTIYSFNGSTYTGMAGMTAISQASSGTTLMSTYTTFEPTATPSAAAGIFHSVYVVGGSTLQDNYTYGIEGMVVARSGNVLHVRGGSVSVNDGSLSTSSTYYLTDSLVTVGPATTVTQDNSAATGLNYNSIGVGQHIAARGNYTLASGVVSIDATSNSSANTGSVRILPEQAQGILQSSGSGSVVLGLQYIDNWPANLFNFAGNGATAAQDTSAGAFTIATTATTTTAVGNTLLASGTIAGFGVTPPDFNATSLTSDTAVPASVRVSWNGTGAVAPFIGLSDAGFSIDTANAAYASGVVRVGSQNIDLASLGATLQIVPLALQSTTTTTTSITTPAAAYNPLFAFGNVATSISCFSVFDTFVTKLNAALPTTPATQFEARGVWNRTTNIFTATTVNVVF